MSSLIGSKAKSDRMRKSTLLTDTSFDDAARSI